MPEAKSIHEVIEQLDQIIDKAVEDGTRLGFFPALYRKVTWKIKEGIEKGVFEDGERMARFDVIFANRYLQAYECFHAGKPCSKSWHFAFESTKIWRHIVLQHLILGMNAHINLDLGIAAAMTVEPGKIGEIKNDFNKVNDILQNLIDEVQSNLARVWPWLGLIDIVAHKFDEFIAGMSIKFYRNSAWKVAETISALPFEERDPAIEKLDIKVSKIGMRMLSPPTFYLQLFFLLIRIGERKSVKRIIELLR